MLYQEIQATLDKNAGQYSIQMSSLLKSSIQDTIQVIPMDYIWILYLAALRYEFFKNINAYRYCLLKIQALKDIQLDPLIKHRLKDLAFIQTRKQTLRNQAILVASITSLLLIAVLVYLQIAIITAFITTMIIAIIQVLVLYVKLVSSFELSLEIKLAAAIDDPTLLAFIQQNTSTNK